MRRLIGPCADGPRVAGLCLLLMLALTFAGCGGGSGAGDSVSVGPFDVRGEIAYTDREYSVSGFTGRTTRKPVRFATVELLSSSGAVLGSGYTDAAGQFVLTATVEAPARIRVLAESGPATDPTIRIKDLTGAIYAVEAPLDPSAPIQDANLNITDTAGVAGAFNIHDALVNGGQFVASLGGTGLGSVDVFWRAGSNALGTYTCSQLDVESGGSFCPLGAGIYLYGGSSSDPDTDQYDDDVIYHEFAHALEFALGMLDSPGGQHLFEDSDLDLRLAWSEGLGAYFSVAIKRWLATQAPQRLSTVAGQDPAIYVDTVGGLASSFDLGAPDPTPCPGGIDCYFHASNEAAVAKALIESTANGGDTGFWQVFAGSLAGGGLARPVSIETFWDQWLGSGLEAGSTRSALIERRIRYLQDLGESAGDDSPLSPGVRLLDCSGVGECFSDQDLTLYKDSIAADRDWLAVDVSAGTYRFRTYDLRDGADTELRLYAADGVSLLARNDDAGFAVDASQSCDTWSLVQGRAGTRNDGSNYSSLIEYQASTATRLYLEVLSSSAGPCPGSGRYGSYSLSVARTH